MESVSAGSRRPAAGERYVYRPEGDRDLLKKNRTQLGTGEMCRGVFINMLISGGGSPYYLDRPQVLYRTPRVSLIARLHRICDCTVNAPISVFVSASHKNMKTNVAPLSSVRFRSFFIPKGPKHVCCYYRLMSL
jgi:hypothetical protein